MSAWEDGPPSWRTMEMPRQSHKTDEVERMRQREFWDLRRMEREWDLTVSEIEACRAAVPHVGTEGNTSALAKVAMDLWGRKFSRLTRQQSQRLDKLAYVLHRFATLAGKFDKPAAEPTCDEKVCRSCGELKGADHFHRDRKHPDNIKARCRTCRNRKRTQRRAS